MMTSSVTRQIGIIMEVSIEWLGMQQVHIVFLTLRMEKEEDLRFALQGWRIEENKEVTATDLSNPDRVVDMLQKIYHFNLQGFLLMKVWNKILENYQRNNGYANKEKINMESQVRILLIFLVN